MRPDGTIVRFALVLAVSAGMVAAEAAPVRKVHRVGVLEASSPAGSSTRVEAFRKGLRDLGYIEGQNLQIDWRFADGRVAVLASLARELVGLSPDVLTSTTALGVDALRKAAPGLPIVIAGTGAESRLIVPENLARPGGNITGVISAERELEGKRMELLREAAPAVSRVAAFRDTTIFPYRLGEAAGSPFDRWGVTFIPIEVRGPADLAAAFAAAVRERAGGRTVLTTRCSTSTAGDSRSWRSRIAWRASPPIASTSRRGA